MNTFPLVLTPHWSHAPLDPLYPMRATMSSLGLYSGLTVPMIESLLLPVSEDSLPLLRVTVMVTVPALWRAVTSISLYFWVALASVLWDTKSYLPNRRNVNREISA